MEKQLERGTKLLNKLRRVADSECGRGISYLEIIGAFVTVTLEVYDVFCTVDGEEDEHTV